MRLAIVSLAVLVALLGFFAQETGFFLADEEPDEPFWEPGEVAGDQALVVRIIDGDTLVVDGGERVRLLGIDTPERGQFYYQEATDFLKGLVEGEEILLEPDRTDRDKYGRLLRYVHMGDTFVNFELVKNGYASTLIYEADMKHASLLLDAERYARDHMLGIWSYMGDFCIGIFHFRYNAPGDDNENLNEEYVSLRNKCFEPVDMEGWELRDAWGNAYTFPPFKLDAKSVVTLHTGSGEDSETDLFWGRPRAVWNNQGDTLLAWNSEKELVLNYTYP